MIVKTQKRVFKVLSLACAQLKLNLQNIHPNLECIVPFNFKYARCISICSSRFTKGCIAIYDKCLLNK